MDECRGLLVTHLDGRVECLDSACVSFDGPRHEWRTGCDDVPGLCDCSVPATAAAGASRSSRSSRSRGQAEAA